MSHCCWPAEPLFVMLFYLLLFAYKEAESLIRTPPTSFNNATVHNNETVKFLSSESTVVGESRFVPVGSRERSFERSSEKLLLHSLLNSVPSSCEPGTNCSSNATKPEVAHNRRLYTDLFRTYRKEIRPVLDHDSLVNVTIQLWFMQLLKIDEIDQILTLYCWVEEYWKDEYLQWNPQDYGNIKVLRVPASDIWRPDILVYNNADMNIRDNELATNVVVNYTGDIVCFRATIFKVTCDLDMKHFPFDEQNCSMMLSSWSYDGSKVFIRPKPNQGNLDYYIHNTEWKLVNFSYQQNIKRYTCCPEPYVDITYSFQLERNPSYYTLNLIIPSILITIVTMVGFFTPYSSTGENTEKVSLGVTALLSLAIILLMVADKMPATSKVIPLIGKYYMGLIFWIFVAAIVTTGTLKIQSKGNAGKPLNPSWRRFFFNIVAKMLLMHIDIPPRTTIPADDSTNSKLNLNGAIGETSFLLTSNTSQGCRQSVQKLARGDSGYYLKVDDCPPSPNFGDERAIWRRPSANTAAAGEPSARDKELILVLQKIRRTMREIDKKLIEEGRLHNIRKEWELLARVCERFLMYSFIIGTLLFAVMILYTPGPARLISW